MPKISELPTLSPATVAAIRSLIAVELNLTKSATANSVLDLRNGINDNGNQLRGYSGSAPQRPAWYFNGAGHFYSVASVTISGQWNQLNGDATRYLEAMPVAHMLGCWADTFGPCTVFRSNQYSNTGTSDSYPTLFASGLGKYVAAIEDDGSLAMGKGTTRASMDFRIGRVGVGLASIDDFATGAHTPNTGNGGMLLKRLAVTGGVEILEGGAGASMGIATLVAGSVVVNTTAVAANSRIFLTSQVDGGTPGTPRVTSRVVGTSFTITSSSADTSQIAWEIKKPYIAPIQAYGGELVTNGTFTTDIVGWIAYPVAGYGPTTLAWDAASGGRLHMANASAATRGLAGLNSATLGYAITAGDSYRIRATLVVVTGRSCAISFPRADFGSPAFSAFIDNNLLPGTYTLDTVEQAVWTGTAHVGLDFANLVGDCYIDNVSVQKLI